jgi:hypothetical protein
VPPASRLWLFSFFAPDRAIQPAANSWTFLVVFVVGPHPAKGGRAASSSGPGRGLTSHPPSPPHLAGDWPLLWRQPLSDESYFRSSGGGDPGDCGGGKPCRGDRRPRHEALSLPQLPQHESPHLKLACEPQCICPSFDDYGPTATSSRRSSTRRIFPEISWQLHEFDTANTLWNGELFARS